MEQKYRAWIIELCEMHEVFAIDFDRHAIRIEPDYDVMIPLKEVHLMQYIGCKDKNEVDVYAGDIIHDHFWNSMWFDINKEVKMPEIYGWLEGNRFQNGMYYEVIGDIHRNLELLDKLEK